nr:hypothetical protein [Labrys miyagiensis]
MSVRWRHDGNGALRTEIKKDFAVLVFDLDTASALKLSVFNLFCNQFAECGKSKALGGGKILDFCALQVFDTSAALLNMKEKSSHLQHPK